MLRRLHNKYFYAGLAFFVWIFFFDRNSLISRYKTMRELQDVKLQREFYHQEIKKDKKATDDLLSDTASLEKFAREKYLMKKDNEDIFLIVEEEKK